MITLQLILRDIQEFIPRNLNAEFVSIHEFLVQATRDKSCNLQQTFATRTLSIACPEFTVCHQQFVGLHGTESYPLFTVLNTIQS